MAYSRTYTLDYTISGDYVGPDSTVNGGIKKLDAEIDLLGDEVANLDSNFYGSSEPNGAVAGQFWTDSSTTPAVLKQYDGSSWSSVASAAGISNLVEDTTPQLGGFLDLNEKSIRHNPAPIADHTYNGDDETNTAGENVVFRDICYLKSDGKYWKADADAVATSAGIIRMASASISADATGIFIIPGDGCYVRDDTWDFATIGAELFIDVTPGGPTTTAPSGDGDIKRIIGHVKTADIIEFKVSETYIELEV